MTTTDAEANALSTSSISCCDACRMSLRSCALHRVLADEKRRIVSAAVAATSSFASSHRIRVNRDGQQPRKESAKGAATAASSSSSSRHQRSCSRSRLLRMVCSAHIGISELSIPLAWPPEQHFKGKGENRTYSMFVVMRTRNAVVDSRLVTGIDRSSTDVNLPESFVFKNEPADFTLEVAVFSVRTDVRSTSVVPFMGSPSTLRQRVSRSLGRAMGTQMKSQLSTPTVDAASLAVDAAAWANGGQFKLLATVRLTAANCGEKIGVFDLNVSAFAPLAGPPLYGHLIARLVALPASVERPLAEGGLTLQRVSDFQRFDGFRARLQSGCLVCSPPPPCATKTRADDQRLVIRFTAKSSISAHPTDKRAFVLSADCRDDQSEFGERRTDSFLVTVSTAELARAWIAACRQMVNDVAAWGVCATKPHSLAKAYRPPPELDTTIGRAMGRRLYDEVDMQLATTSATVGRAAGHQQLLQHNPRNPTTAPTSRRHLLGPLTVRTTNAKSTTTTTAVAPRMEDEPNEHDSMATEPCAFARTAPSRGHVRSRPALAVHLFKHSEPPAPACNERYVIQLAVGDYRTPTKQMDDLQRVDTSYPAPICTRSSTGCDKSSSGVYSSDSSYKSDSPSPDFNNNVNGGAKKQGWLTEFLALKHSAVEITHL